MPKTSKKKVKKVVEGVLEGKTQGEAMRDAGYSESYSRVPNQMKSTRSWEEILSTTFSDEFVAKEQEKLIKHKVPKNLKFPYMTPDNEIYEMYKICGGECLYIGDEVRGTAQGVFRWRTGVGWVSNADMVDKQIEKLYKLKGYYKNSDITSTTNIYTASLEDLIAMDKELEKEDKLFNERLNKYAPTTGAKKSAADKTGKGKNTKGDTKGKDKA
ncbi:MAG: hypothetical protein RBT33_03960 [Candidatus Dojkabacteria bacterium]|jgi:hypothetical protein|nr:hypothetical protein [Candidatus Dojkabacteria bacterium]